MHEVIQEKTIENKNMMEMLDKFKSENDFIKNEAKKLEEQHDDLIQNNV